VLGHELCANTLGWQNILTADARRVRPIHRAVLEVVVSFRHENLQYNVTFSLRLPFDPMS